MSNNRIIKFRAWNCESKQMLSPMDKNWEKINLLVSGELNKDDHYLLQYTGKDDKNGIEIYEGDILRCEYTPDPSKYMGNTPKSYECMVEIRWFEFSCQFKGHNIRKGKLSKAWENKPLNQLREMEVIGNIYEHPSLLTP